jgi:hypothetical protein
VSGPFRNPPTGDAPTDVTTVGSGTRLSTRAARAIELVTFTESSLSKPAEMARKLTDMARTIQRIGRLVFASPLLRANTVRGLTFTAATARDIPHHLGRKWEGAMLVTPVGGALGYQVARVSDAVDAGTIRVTTSANITADLVVW